MGSEMCIRDRCHAHPVLHRLAQRPPSVPASTITPDEIAYDDSKSSKKKNSCGAGMSDACPVFSAGMLNSSSVCTRIPPCRASHDSRKAQTSRGASMTPYQTKAHTHQDRYAPWLSAVSLLAAPTPTTAARREAARPTAVGGMAARG